jgi:chromosome segregation ATPase
MRQPTRAALVLQVQDLESRLGQNSSELGRVQIELQRATGEYCGAKRDIEELQRSQRQLRDNRVTLNIQLGEALDSNSRLAGQLRQAQRELQVVKEELESAMQHIEQLEMEGQLADAKTAGKMEGVQQVYREMLDRTEATATAKDLMAPLMESLGSPSLMAMLGGRRR